jgi:hypothetical protein
LVSRLVAINCTIAKDRSANHSKPVELTASATGRMETTCGFAVS